MSPVTNNGAIPACLPGGARAVALSFTDYNLLEADKGVDFIGLANFGWIWRQDLFWVSLWNTAILTDGQITA